MASISIASVSFPGAIPPTVPITGVIIRHRVTADPDILGSYTTDTSVAVILTNGNIQAGPFVIGGLDNNVQYTVWVKPPCGNGFKKNFTTPGKTCVDCTDITGTVAE